MTETATVRDPYTTWQPEFATMLAGDGHADTLIVPLVEALRAKGVTTFGSCQGHDESECVSTSCAAFPDLCHASHPGQLVVDGRALDPTCPLWVESPVFTYIACQTFPRFVWHFRWRSRDRDLAIGLLFDLEPAKDGKEATP